MTATQLIAAFLYAAIGQSVPDYLEVDTGVQVEAFYARCQLQRMLLAPCDQEVHLDRAWFRSPVTEGK